MGKSILIIAIGYIVLIWGGSLLASFVCRRLRRPDDKDAPGRGAGKYTGYFERLIVGSAVFLGQPGWSVLNLAAAFVLLAKLTLMCLEIRGDSDMSRVERRLAGTVASLFVALLIGYVLKTLLPDLFAIHAHPGLIPQPGMGY